MKVGDTVKVSSAFPFGWIGNIPPALKTVRGKEGKVVEIMGTMVFVTVPDTEFSNFPFHPEELIEV